MTQTPPWRAPQQRQKARPAQPQPQPQETGPRRYRPDIQGLRAIAVLLVILYHAKVPFVTGGYVGVDVFFVISGFLITGQLTREVSKRGRIHFGDFYLKRIRRLLPPAALVVVVTMLAARKWAPPLSVEPWGFDAIFTAFYGINYRLAALGVDYQNADGQESPFQHYWSLAVEEQYYLLWPILIMAVVLLARRRWRWALPVALIVGAAASLYVSVKLVDSNAPLAYFSIQSRAWELGAGALVALGAERFSRINHRVAGGLSYLGLALIVGTGLYYTDATAFPGLPATVPVLGTTLLIIAGCVPSRVGAESTLLRWRPMQGIGRVSYSWYLWHWPLLILIPMMAPNYHFGWIRNLEVMVLALWLAVLTYFLVENLALKSIFKRLTWTLRAVLASGAMVGTAAIAIVSMPVLTGNGAALSVVSTAHVANAAYMQNVTDQLSDSALIKQAPKNLTPDLQDAATDYPESSRSGGDCLANYLVVSQGKCVFGDTDGTKTMVLLGDSHAEQWEPAFAEAGRREHWKVVTWTKSACPLADLSINSPQLGRAYTECDKWRAQAIDRTLALKPDLVVIGQSDSVTGKAFSDKVWADKTLEATQMFATANIPVTYMLDTVYPYQDIPKCVTQNLEDVRQCVASGRESWVSRRHDLVAKTLSSANVPLVEPSPWQCGRNRCPVIVGNMLVYRDASHFTATYSKWLAPLIQPLLRDPNEARVTQAEPAPAIPATGSFQQTTISAQGTVTVDHWIRTGTPIGDIRLTPPSAMGAAVRATDLEVVADRRLVPASAATVTPAGRTVTFPEPASLVHVRYRLVGAVERSWSVPGRVLVQPAALGVNYSPRVGPTKVSVRGVNVLAMACRDASAKASNPVPCGGPTKQGWTETLREDRRNASVIVQAQLS